MCCMMPLSLRNFCIVIWFSGDGTTLPLWHASPWKDAGSVLLAPQEQLRPPVRPAIVRGDGRALLQGRSEDHRTRLRTNEAALHWRRRGRAEGVGVGAPGRGASPPTQHEPGIVDPA